MAESPKAERTVVGTEQGEEGRVGHVAVPDFEESQSEA